MSWDIKSGSRHFYLHPRMRDFFLFRYNGRYHLCIALPFGWGPSVLWFTKLLRPLVKHLIECVGYRILPYIDDFACAPSPLGRASTRHGKTARGPVGDCRGCLRGWGSSSTRVKDAGKGRLRWNIWVASWIPWR